jgi:hypothetical protein
MDRGSSAELQAAKKAFTDAERAWRRTKNAYYTLWRERRMVNSNAEPSDAEVCAEAAHLVSSAALSEARNRLDLLRAEAVWNKPEKVRAGRPRQVREDADE